jgi:hypothetical protein
VHWDEIAGAIQLASGSFICGQQLLRMRAGRGEPATTRKRARESAGTWLVGATQLATGCLFLTSAFSNQVVLWLFVSVEVLVLAFLVSIDLRGWRRSRRRRSGPAAAPGC